MTTPTDHIPHDAYAALRLPNFRLLLVGRLVAQLGEMMVSVAVGWELYDRTSDPLLLGMVGLVQVVPIFLLSLPVGYLVDRYDRRWIALISQVVLVVCSLLLASLSAAQGSLLSIFIVLAIIGAARAFNNPAEGALTPQAVPIELYQNAATWGSSTWQFASIIGPAIGGFIIALTQGAATVYIVNAVVGLVFVAALLIVKLRPQSYAPAEEGPVRSLMEGLRFLKTNRIVLASITLDMFAVLLGGATYLLPVFAKDILFVDATGLGLLRAAPSVGAVLIAILIANRPPFQNAGRTLLWAVAGFGVATIIFGISSNFWLSMAILALLGALDNISVVIRHVLLLTYTPPEMLGRVGAVNTVFIGASNELGGFESGLAAWLLGPVGAVVFGGIGTLFVVLGIARFSPELRNLRQIAHPEKPA
jgi:MFS family permease